MWPYTTQEMEILAAPGSAVEPRGELAARTVAMPADTNPAGEVFGGWIMSLMDAAGMMTATKLAQGRVVTASVTDMSFHAPVSVGDVVCCYADLVEIRNTSARLHVEVWALRDGLGERVMITSAEFTFVALNDNRKPRAFRREGAPSHPN